MLYSLIVLFRMYCSFLFGGVYLLWYIAWFSLLLLVDLFIWMGCLVLRVFCLLFVVFKLGIIVLCVYFILLFDFCNVLVCFDCRFGLLVGAVVSWFCDLLRCLLVYCWFCVRLWYCCSFALFGVFIVCLGWYVIVVWGYLC